MGFDEASFKRDCRRLADGVRRSVPPAIGHASEILAGEVRERCPVDEGDLVASVEVGPGVADRGRFSRDVTVGRGLERPEVSAVEYGTRDDPPQPFIRPAIDAKGPAMARIIESAFP